MQKINKCVGWAATAAAWVYVIAIAVIMPFYFTNGYGTIGSDKGRFFEKFGFPIVIAGCILTLIWVVLVWIESLLKGGGSALTGWLKQRFSMTDIFVLCYAAALLLSFVCSDYQEVALYGNAKWPMGLYPHLALTGSYFLLSRAFRGERQFFSLLWKVTAVVFGLGLLNRFGVYPIKMEYASAGFISTIGNINWFCGYWSVVAWISVVFYWNQEVRTDGKNRYALIGYGILSCLAMTTGIAQGSDSGILAMTAVLVLLLCLSAGNGDRMQRFWELALILCAGCGAANLVTFFFPTALNYESVPIHLLFQSVLPWIGLVICGVFRHYIKKQNTRNLFPARIWRVVVKWLLLVTGVIVVLYFLVTLLNTLLPSGLGPLAGKNAFTFSKMWAAQRGGTWAAGWRCWWEQDLLHKLFGVGPDGMWSYISSGKAPDLLQAVKEQFPYSRLLNAHGEWITVLANLGLCGLFGFAGMILSFVYRFIKAGKENPACYVFAVCVFAYTVNNIFSFQTTSNVTHLFLMMGVGESLWRRACMEGSCKAKML